MRPEEFLDDPEFGKLFRGNMHVRNIFNKYLHTSIDPLVSRLRNKLSIGFDKDNKLTLSSKELNYTYSREQGESTYDFMMRVVTGVRQGTSPRTPTDLMNPSEGLPIDLLRSAEVVRSHRTIASAQNVEDIFGTSPAGWSRGGLEALSRRGFVPQILTFNNRNTADTERILGGIGRSETGNALGWILPDDNTIQALRIFNPATEKFLDLEEIFNITGTNIKIQSGVVSKRMRGLTNRTQLNQSFQRGDLRAAFFDDIEFFSQRAENVKNVQTVASALAAHAENPAAFDTEAFTKKMFERMGDGYNLIRQSTVENMIREARIDLEQRKALLDKSFPLNSPEHRKGMRIYEQIKANLDQRQKNVLNGQGYSIRGMAIRDILDGNEQEAYSMIKGHAIVTPDDEFNALARSTQAFAGLTDEEIGAVQVLAPRSTRKIKELAFGDTFTPYLSLEEMSGTKVAYSNALSLGTFGVLDDPTTRGDLSFMRRSLDTSLRNALEGIESGRLPPAMIDLVDEIAALDPEEYIDNPSEYAAKLKAKGYAKRIKDFLESGGDISTNDVMVSDLIRITKEHHFGYRSRRFGNEIDTGLGAIKDYGLNIPMIGSTRGYIRIPGADRDTLTSDAVSRLRGMTIRPDYDTGINRLLVNERDIALTHIAFGGSDLDDSFRLVYRYDSKAKRLLARTGRDPDTVGEYFLFEADITRDKNFAKLMIDGQSVQGLESEVLQLQRKIEGVIGSAGQPTAAQEADIMKWHGRINEIRTKLNQFYSTSDLVEDIDVSDVYARDVVSRKYRYTPAPNAWEATEETLSAYNEGLITRGYATRNFGTVDELIAAYRTAFVAEEIGDVRMPFQFRGDDFREYDATGFYRHMTPLGDPTVRPFANVKELSDLIDMDARTMAEAEGLLGKGVNMNQLIHNFISTISNQQVNGFDEMTLDRIHEILRKHQNTIISHESFIDAATKHGSAEALAEVENALRGNVQNMGRVLGELHQAGLLTPSGNKIGISSMFFSQRFNRGYLPELRAGYAESVGDALDTISDEDFMRRVMSPEGEASDFFTNFMRDVQAREGKFEDEGLRAQVKASESLIEELKDFDVSAVERDRAEQFLRGYYNDKRELSNILRDDPRKMLGLLEDSEMLSSLGEDELANLFGEFTSDEVHFRSMSRLSQMGFDNLKDLNRQLLAIAKVASENRLEDTSIRMSALEPLMQTIISPGSNQGTLRTSIGEMFNRALGIRREDAMYQTILDEVYPGFDPINDSIFDVLKPYLNTRGETKRLLRDRTLLAVAQNLKVAGGTGADPLLKIIAERNNFTLGNRPSIEDAIDEFDSVLYNSTVRTDMAPPPGISRLLDREAADEISSVIAEPKLMRSLDMNTVKELMQNSGVRKGLYAAGIFAGLGILHEVRGERTVDDLEGPLLLPGGSAYEQGSNPFELQSIYSSVPMGTGGYTYRIRANGDIDPTTMRGEIESITGTSPNANIFNSRRTSNQTNRSSVDVLNSLLE